MVLRTELADILARLLPDSKLVCHHAGEEFFGLDERYLHVSVWVAIECQLCGHICREREERSEVLSGDVLLHELDLFVGAVDGSSLWRCEYIVELSDELLDSRDELDDTLWDEDCTEVVAFFRTLCHSLGDVSDYIVE